MTNVASLRGRRTQGGKHLTSTCYKASLDSFLVATRLDSIIIIQIVTWQIWGPGTSAKSGIWTMSTWAGPLLGLVMKKKIKNVYYSKGVNEFTHSRHLSCCHPQLTRPGTTLRSWPLKQNLGPRKVNEWKFYQESLDSCRLLFACISQQFWDRNCVTQWSGPCPSRSKWLRNKLTWALK